jgi:hypothetical protein
MHQPIQPYNYLTVTLVRWKRCKYSLLPLLTSVKTTKPHLHFTSLISTTDDLGGSYRRFRCLSKYIHELSPADDGCWPPLIAPGSSMLKLSRYEAFQLKWFPPKSQKSSAKAITTLLGSNPREPSNQHVAWCDNLPPVATTPSLKTSRHSASTNTPLA